MQVAHVIEVNSTRCVVPFATNVQQRVTTGCTASTHMVAQMPECSVATTCCCCCHCCYNWCESCSSWPLLLMLLQALLLCRQDSSYHMMYRSPYIPFTGARMHTHTGSSGGWITYSRRNKPTPKPPAHNVTRTTTQAARVWAPNRAHQHVG